MSAPPELRRVDKAMPHAQALDFLQRGFCGRLATIGEDGYPYCIPLLYVWIDGEKCLHNARSNGHLRANIEYNPRICFEVDEPERYFLMAISSAIRPCRSEVSLRSDVRASLKNWTQSKDSSNV